MKKQILISLIVSGFLFYFSGEAVSGGNEKSNKENYGMKRAVTSSIISFDVGAEKLPPNYKGADVARLYALLTKKAPKGKSEFETTAEYEKRIAEIAFDDIYALKIESAYDFRGLTIHPYDADLQKIQIILETEPLSDYSSLDYRSSLLIKGADRASSSYVGSNAYGAKLEVKDFTATHYGIALVNQVDFGDIGYKHSSNKILESVRELKVEIHVPPDKAKVLKESVGVLILCKPALYRANSKIIPTRENDLTFEQFNSSKATIDKPESHFFQRKYINVEVLGVWVYDIRTGEVLSKQKIKENCKDSPWRDVCFKN